MAQALDAQGPDLGARAVPDLLPRPLVDLLDAVGLGELARVHASSAAVALRPLPPPQPDVRLRPEAALLGRPPVERGDDVLNSVDVEDGGSKYDVSPATDPKVLYSRNLQNTKDGDP